MHRISHYIVFLFVLTTAIVCFSASILSFFSSRQPLHGHLVPSSSHVLWVEPNPHASSSDTEARFFLRNAGNSSVRILELNSSCGCAQPVATPMVIRPGGACVVSIKPSPIAVGTRFARLDVITDSRITPELSLTLEMRGSRKPPFLGQALADLSYSGYDLSGIVRTIRVSTVELADTPPRPPLCTSESELIHISSPKLVSQSPYLSADTLHREYALSVQFRSNPTPGSYATDITIEDPWDSTNVHRIRLHADVYPDLRVVPSRFQLSWPSTSNVPPPPARFKLISRTPYPELRIVPKPPLEDLICITPSSTSQDGLISTYSISLTRPPPDSVSLELTVLDQHLNELLRIPIAIRREFGQ
jgi:hypothetical protein